MRSPDESDVVELDPLAGMGALAHVVDAAREEERCAFARQIHDTVIQPLTLLIMSLTLFERQPDGTRSLETFIDTWKQQAQEALDSLRLTMMGISWQLSKNSSLNEALHSFLLPQLKQREITLTIEERSWPPDLPLEWTSQLYLTVREALTNVQKHTRASEARVILDCDSQGRLVVVIQDDGGGFPRADCIMRSPHVAGSGFGFAGMQARVHTLGGQMTIDGAPGAGSRIEIVVPAPITSQWRRAVSEVD